ncbi:MAG: hypothetical protein ACH37Z_15620 [Anaerolineae bacterium]
MSLRESVSEWAPAMAYALVLLGMGLVVLAGGSLLLALRLTGWLFGLPARLLGPRR